MIPHTIPVAGIEVEPRQAVRISLTEHGHLVDARLVGEGGATKRNFVLHRGTLAGPIRMVETVEDAGRTRGMLK